MQFTRRRIADAGLLVLVNAMWAAQYPAYKTATCRAGPEAISVWTFLIASVVLLGEKSPRPCWPAACSRWPEQF